MKLFLPGPIFASQSACDRARCPGCPWPNVTVNWMEEIERNTHKRVSVEGWRPGETLLAYNEVPPTIMICLQKFSYFWGPIAHHLQNCRFIYVDKSFTRKLVSNQSWCCVSANTIKSLPDWKLWASFCDLMMSPMAMAMPPTISRRRRETTRVTLVTLNTKYVTLNTK